MSALVLIIILLFIFAVIGAIMFFLLKGGDHETSQEVSGLRNQYKQANVQDVQEIKEKSGRGVQTAKIKVDLETKKFRAGYYTDKDFEDLRFKFLLYRIAPTIIFAFLGYMAGKMGLELGIWPQMGCVIVGGVVGFFIGLALPESVLDDTIKKRHQEAVYYLPMVIEQLGIGVSSGLDLGPCISYVIEAATKRRSHNVVTEMLVHVEKLVQAGYSLSEALLEVGEAFGQKEVAHTFMFLSQVSKQGGEISKQLQDLGESVLMHRQIQVEGQITALPVKATGPLAMVFGGFFIMLMGSVFVSLFQNLNAAQK